MRDFLWRACAVADFARNHPMAQGLLSHIVGEGQGWVFQHMPDGLPIIEQFARQLFGFFMRMVSVLLAQHLQLRQVHLMFFYQVERVILTPYPSLISQPLNPSRLDAITSQLR